MANFEHTGEKIPSAPSKDPDSVIDYGVDWSRWLRDGETISTSTWLVEDGLTIEREAFSDTITTVVLSGGTVNTQYTITNRVVTSFGAIDDRSMKIKCREK